MKPYTVHVINEHMAVRIRCTIILVNELVQFRISKNKMRRAQIFPKGCLRSELCNAVGYAFMMYFRLESRLGGDVAG